MFIKISKKIIFSKDIKEAETAKIEIYKESKHCFI